MNPNIFVFKWEVPGEKHQQITWTVLPQGFRDSPHLFGQAFSQDLLDLDLGPNGKILQYVDDLLICSPDEKNAQQHTNQVLNFLAERGYKVSHALAWLKQRSLTWQFRLHRGPGSCPSDRVQAMLQLPSPTTPKQLRTFLRLTVESGYCRIWISNYGLIAQPLYESLKWRDDSILLMWGTPPKKIEATLKQNLTQAPALRLSDPEKAFQLYVHEKKGIDLGVLTQRLGLEPQACSLLIQEVRPSCPRLTSLPSKSCSYCSPVRRCLKTLFWGQTNYF